MITLMVFCLGALLLAVIGYLAVGFLIGTGDEVLVPNVVGKPSGEAMEILLTAGLRPAMPIEEGYHDDIEVDRIIEQNPMPGSRVKRGREIRLVKSLGSKKVPVPYLNGMDLRGAEWELRRAGLKLGQLVTVPHPQVEEGLIIAHSPPGGSRLEKTSSVDLLLSGGPAPELLIMPRLQGLSAPQARALLTALGVERIREDPIEAKGSPIGRVRGQYPRAGLPAPADREVILAVTAPDRRQGEPRYRLLSYSIEPALGPGRIEVWLKDDSGVRRIVNRTMKSGGQLEFMERLLGNAGLVIYQDGRRVLSDFLPEKE
jgi:serine/threonine-protein kinase